MIRLRVLVALPPRYHMLFKFHISETSTVVRIRRTDGSSWESWIAENCKVYFIGLFFYLSADLTCVSLVVVMVHDVQECIYFRCNFTGEEL